MDRGAWWATVQGSQESDMTEATWHAHMHLTRADANSFLPYTLSCCLFTFFFLPYWLAVNLRPQRFGGSCPSPRLQSVVQSVVEETEGAK